MEGDEANDHVATMATKISEIAKKVEISQDDASADVEKEAAPPASEHPRFVELVEDIAQLKSEQETIIKNQGKMIKQQEVCFKKLTEALGKVDELLRREHQNQANSQATHLDVLPPSLLRRMQEATTDSGQANIEQSTPVKEDVGADEVAHFQ